MYNCVITSVKLACFSSGEYFSYVPCFPFISPFIVPIPAANSKMVLTLLFAACMLDNGTSHDNSRSGDGSTFLGLKYFSINIFKLSRKIT